MPLKDWSDDKASTIARKAVKEAERAQSKGGRLAVREAAEKTYLASIEIARDVMRRSGIPIDKSQRSSSAIGHAMNKLEARTVGADAKQVSSALARAQSQHTACFYDGICDSRVVVKVARDVARAAKVVRRLKFKP